MLSAIVFLPAAGAVLIFLLLRDPRHIRWAAVAVALGTFVLTAVLYSLFDRESQALQFVERHWWIRSAGVQYFLAVDGLNLPMILLTGLLGLAAVLTSWSISYRHREYFALLLILETAAMGVFASLDFLQFFLFWELELIPMYLLISIWGSPPPMGRREYSAMKFLIITVLGSAFMLVGILILYFSTGTFDLIELGQRDIRPVIFSLPTIFWLLFVAYAVKLPMVPLHTWLPDAHTDAPTAVSVMLAGVLLKMGGYAMLRTAVTIFPGVALDMAWILATFGVVGVLYGAVITLRQRDLKRLIAYSSVSHMGYVLLGIAAMTHLGLAGATFQMFAHGVITGLLFAIVGIVYDKTHTRQIEDLGGLARQMPVLAVVFLVAGLAALGLPGLSGFVAEFLVFNGAYSSSFLAGAQLYAVLGVIGIVLTAGYILWTLQRVLYGPQLAKFDGLSDVRGIEAVPLFALLAPIVLFGVYPGFLTSVINMGVAPIVARLLAG